MKVIACFSLHFSRWLKLLFLFFMPRCKCSAFIKAFACVCVCYFFSYRRVDKCVSVNVTSIRNSWGDPSRGQFVFQGGAAMVDCPWFIRTMSQVTMMKCISNLKDYASFIWKGKLQRLQTQREWADDKSTADKNARRVEERKMICQEVHF